jgi:Pyruvate/2-oxoglutarate dehydrogenase complex, dihydrolipoamide dehydrogenase (E3) component, and related enzymes
LPRTRFGSATASSPPTASSSPPARARGARVPGIDEVDWIDHVSALELEEIPESLLVVGGGPVGLEFAQIFARFGSRVTIVNRDSQIAARSDAEAANELHAAFEAEGIEIVLDSAVESFAGEGDTTVATLNGGREVRVARVLLASGRVPNTEELAPERAGVETDRGYIVVDDRQRTTARESGPRATSPSARSSRLRLSTRPGSRSRTCSEGRTARGLLGHADCDLHRSGARFRRADGA